jgi:5-oxoprolinase (ATP-hydrolysing)
MVHIRDNAEEAVRKMLVEFSLKNGMKEIETVEEEEFMDDGTRIKLRLTIDRSSRTAVFDFTGSGSEVYGNTNAPESITRSAIIYSLRSLIKSEIPLNSGCLRPVRIIVPPKSILSPSPGSAVVGGNVETSQRLVDVILKPFKFVAASQGTMNNFLFGTEKLSYYETIAGGSGAG